MNKPDTIHSNSNSEYYIGLLSGTSIDNIDVGIFKIGSHKISMIDAINYNIDNTIKDNLNNLITTKQSNLKVLGMLNRELGNNFADAVLDILTKNKISSDKITAIGFHGQTIYHNPIQPNNFSMQIGDPNTIIEKTSIPVISDFRQRDMVNNGQGAPLAPLFHQEFFSSTNVSRAIINIGGISNITLLEKKGVHHHNIIASDLGPGNTLLDHWFSLHNPASDYSYDNNGEFAKSGRLNNELLTKLLTDDYFQLNWPKSTGREYFNLRWLDKYLTGYSSIDPKDIQRTLLELTATLIKESVNSSSIDLNEVYLCGGGAKNIYLKERITKLLPNHKVALTNELDIDSDWVESATFAWLAYSSWHKIKHDLSKITGNAKSQTQLGCIYYN